MELAFKPDLEEALTRWRAFWQQDLIKRPCVAVTAPRDGVAGVPGPPGQVLPDAAFPTLLDQAEAQMATIYYAGEAMPIFQPSFGPDQLAAFVGARLDHSAASAGTTWSVPYVESWEDALPLELGANSNAWDRMLEFCRLAGARGDGKYLVGMLDLHSNLDWLAAIRDPMKLCLDLVDCPDTIDRAMDQARALYPTVYNGLYDAGNMAGRGTCGWLPYFCEGRYATVQCDFACLLSPPQFNRFVLPALSEECAFLEHTVYHYDGPGALTHFDAITGIAELDGIQWTPGAGAKPMVEWMDLLKRCQARGKNVFIACSADELKVFHRELAPNLVFYRVHVSSQAKADELLQWLELNT